MTLYDFVRARQQLHVAAESPAEKEMCGLLLRAVEGAIYVKPELVVFIEPQKQVADGKYRVDWLLENGDKRFAVEVDGLAYHGDQVAFQRDRQRDRVLQESGFVVVRFTAKEVFEQRNQVEIELMRRLAHLYDPVTGKPL